MVAGSDEGLVVGKEGQIAVRISHTTSTRLGFIVNLLGVRSNDFSVCRRILER